MDNVHTVVLTQAMVKASYDRMMEQRDELLEALHGLVDGLIDKNNDFDAGLTDKEWEQRIKDARAAIARAEGKIEPDPEICPICHSDIGHRVNCPRGIAFIK